jgi:hypothetical protein
MGLIVIGYRESKEGAGEIKLFIYSPMALQPVDDLIV